MNRFRQLHSASAFFAMVWFGIAGSGPVLALATPLESSTWRVPPYLAILGLRRLDSAQELQPVFNAPVIVFSLLLLFLLAILGAMARELQHRGRRPPGSADQVSFAGRG